MDEHVHADGRAAPRFDVGHAVQFEAVQGATLNISNRGIYFVSPVQHELGSRISFSIVYTHAGRPARLRCDGRIVRVDSRDDGVGVAAALDTPFFADEQSIALS